MTSTPATPQLNVIYAQTQSSERAQQSIEDQSTIVINQSMSSGDAYTNDSLTLASSQEAFIYENPQDSDQVQEQIFSVTSDNSYAFTDYSSTQIDSQSTSYIQADSQVSMMTDTCYVSDGSNMVTESSTNIEIDVHASTFQSTDQVFAQESAVDMSVDISVDGTQTYYQNDVNDNYSGDGDW